MVSSPSPRSTALDIGGRLHLNAKMYFCEGKTTSSQDLTNRSCTKQRSMIDITPDLSSQTFCTRVCLWPCQSGIALSNAFMNCDIDGICKVFCCCPVRLLVNPCRSACAQRFANNHSLTFFVTSIRSKSAARAVDGARQMLKRARIPSPMRSRTHVSLSWRKRRGQCRRRVLKYTKEMSPHTEPDEIPYTRVFEMEKKKRVMSKMSAQIY
jgi:hypothetical protein